MLAVRGIDKRFGARRALAGVTFDAAPGAVVLVVGRNGAGKTTLLRIISGFLDPDAGEVTIAGIPLASQRTRAQAKLGYLPEAGFAPPDLIVADHLYLRARQKRVADPTAEIARVSELAAIAGELDRRIGTLSKGFRQRIGLADALLGDPPLLVLDEPTSGMDPVQVTELRERLRAIAADQRTLVISSHAIGELAPLATTIAVLRAGKLVAYAPPDQLDIHQLLDDEPSPTVESA